MNQVHFAYRPLEAGDGFHSAHSTYSVRVEGDRLEFRPIHHAKVGGIVAGEAFGLRTSAIRRGDDDLLPKSGSWTPTDDGGLSRHAPAVREHLHNGQNGVEQSWHFAAEPEGAGDLVIRIEIDGYRWLAQSDDGLHFEDPRTKLGVRYGVATWIDADNRRATLQPRWDGGAIELRLPPSLLAASSYPAVLDPWISPEYELGVPVLGPAAQGQSEVDVAFDGTNYLLVWWDWQVTTASTAGNLETIRGTRVSTSGAILDPWGLQISPEGTRGFRSPRVASSGAEYLVVWNTSFNSDVLGVRVDTGGNVLDAAAITIAAAPGSQREPAVAFDGTDYLVVWQDERSGPADIYAGRVSKAGVALDGTGFVVSAESGEQRAPDVACSAVSCQAVWEDRRSGSAFVFGGRVAGNTSLDLGGNAVLLSGGGQETPSIDFDGTNYLVAWRSTSGILGARIDTAGTTVDATALGIGAGGYEPEVAFGGAGYLVAWQTKSDTSDVFSNDVRAQRVGTGGALAGGAIVVASKSGVAERAPAIAFDGSSFLVAYHEGVNNDTDVRGARVQGDGTVLDAPPFLISTGANAQENPATASDGTNFFVVWEDGRMLDENGWGDLYGARLSAAGTLLDPAGIPISTAAGFQLDPDVEWDGSNYFIVWRDSRNGATEIFGTRVTPDGVVLDPDGIGPISDFQGAQTPHVGFNGTHLLVAWNRSSKPWARRLTPAGSFVDSVPILLEDLPSGAAAYPMDIASNGADWLVAMREYRFGNYDVFAVRIAADGTNLDPSGIPIHTDFEHEFTGGVAWNGASYLIVWEDHTPSPWQIFGARVDATGTVLDILPFQISASALGAYSPRVVFDGNDWFVSWSRGVGAVDTDVLGAWADASGSLVEPPIDIAASVQPESLSSLSTDGHGRTLAAHLRFDPTPTVHTMRIFGRYVAAVEEPMRLIKTVSPTSVPEPGGTVPFNVRVENTGLVASLDLESLVDDLHGNLDGQGTCSLPQTITAAGFYECSFSTTVSGNAGVVETDTITASGQDDGGVPLQSIDSASVRITDVSPTATVNKTASPVSVLEPGGTVTFTIRADNTGSAEPLVLTALADDLHGDLGGQGSCALPQIIAPGSFYQCSFSAMVTGNAGDSEVDTVTATLQDDDGNVVTPQDSATVTITDVLPVTAVTKTALPVSVPEPGGPVTFTVRIDNLGSAEALDLTALADDVHGNLGGQGTCSVPQNVDPGSFYQCSLSATVSGNAGDSETDTVTATLQDDDGNVVTPQGSATVTVSDVAPAATVTKTPSSDSVPEPGGEVSFTVRIDNTGSAEELGLIALVDDVHGNLGGQGTCTLPQTIAVGSFYECSFPAEVKGVPGDSETDTVTATVQDDDGNVLMPQDSATVGVTDVLPMVSVTKTPSPTAVDEPGGLVTFTVRVGNSGIEPLELTALVDDVHGDLDGQGTCSMPQPLDPGYYECTFEDFVGGAGGDSQTDTVTATVNDDEGNVVTHQGSATVTITDLLPTATVTKTASPTSVPEPGGDVTFTVRVDNTAGSAESIHLTSLVDDIHGSLQGQGDCETDTSIGADSFYQCSFMATISGNAGDIEIDTITATANDDEGNEIRPQGSASVAVTDVLPTATLTKTATPTSVPEPGGDVTFTVEVNNTGSAEPLELTALVDNLHGNLDGQGTCLLPQSLAPGSLYQCAFMAAVNGSPGDSETDTVTATMQDDDGNGIAPRDSATVTVTDVAPMITVDLSASPIQMAEPGGDFTFQVALDNTSTFETIGLISLTDDQVGDLDGVGSCEVPKQVLPGQSYSCTYVITFLGVGGDQQVHLLAAEAWDDEFNSTVVSDTATITISDSSSPTIVTLEAISSSDVVDLADCLSLDSAIRSVRIGLSEAMLDLPGTSAAGDIDAPASYLLVEAGVDRAFSSQACLPPAGDDVGNVVESVDYDPLTATAVLSLDRPILPAGLYRLFVCSNLEDLAGNRLDGDGDGVGGDDHIVTFRSDPGNLFDNGHFDCGIEQWSSLPVGSIDWIWEDLTDHEGSPLSGSAQKADPMAETVALGQCAPVATALDHRVAGRLQAAGVPGDVVVTCEEFAVSSCGGVPVASQSSATPFIDTGGGWLPFEVELALEAGVRSLACSIEVSAAEVGELDAWLDALRLEAIEVIFADGFESGDVSAWSTSLP